MSKPRGHSNAHVEQTEPHTPTPWRLAGKVNGYVLIGADNSEILPPQILPPNEGYEEDLRFIVAAVNNYASLVAALRDELEAIRVWQSQPGYEWRVPSGMREGLGISVSKIHAALSRVRE